MKRLTSKLFNTKRAIKNFLVGTLASAAIVNPATAMTPPQELINKKEESIERLWVQHENKNVLSNNLS